LPESESELYRPSDRRLSAKLVPTFAHKGYRVVIVTDSYGRILGFLDWSRYFFFQVASQLYSRGWVDPVLDSLLLRKSGSAGNRTRTTGTLSIRPQKRSVKLLTTHKLAMWQNSNADFSTNDVTVVIMTAAVSNFDINVTSWLTLVNLHLIWLCHSSGG
jgi:hypothetical protein